jgi:hypothetical protein
MNRGETGSLRAIEIAAEGYRVSWMERVRLRGGDN